MKITDRIDRVTHVSDAVKTPNPPFPKVVKIEITSRCNYKCSFCGAHKPKRCASQDMDPKLVYKIIDDCARLKVREIGFFLLGEPLLVDQLPKYIKYAKDCGIEYTFITTNCEYLIPDRFIPVVEAGLDGIKFSCAAGSRDLYKKLHNVDNFDLVIAHIKRFSEYMKENGLSKPSTAVGTVYYPGKEEDIKKLRGLIGDCVDEVYALPLYNQGGLLSGEKYEIYGNPGRYENMVPTVPCWGLFNKALVRWDGYLEMCCYGHDERFLVADLKKTKLEDAWLDEKFVDLRKAHLENKIKDTICAKCQGLA